MITKEQIETLNFELFGVSRNGGTLIYRSLKKDLFCLHYNGSNFIYKNDNDPRLTEFVIERVIPETLKFELVDRFNTEDFNKLKEKLKEHEL